MVPTTYSNIVDGNALAHDIRGQPHPKCCLQNLHWQRCHQRRLNSLLMTLWVAFYGVNYVFTQSSLAYYNACSSSMRLSATLLSTSPLSSGKPRHVSSLTTLRGPKTLHLVACLHHTHWIGPHYASSWELVNLIFVGKTLPWLWMLLPKSPPPTTLQDYTTSRHPSPQSLLRAPQSLLLFKTAIGIFLK